MNTEKKHRIVGFIVLIAACAIILPWILHHSRAPSMAKVLEQVPPSPNAPQVSMIIPTVSAMREQREPALPLRAVPNRDSDWARSAERSLSATVEPCQQPDKPVLAVEMAESSKSKPPAIASVARSAWALQVGTYSQFQQADRLARQLRQQGYDVYQQDVTVAHKTLRRVYIGPNLDRQALERVQKQLRQHAGMHGIVVKYRLNSHA